jgi:ubiquinone/menaquinone biosynthesis C-methylase UbiE
MQLPVGQKDRITWLFDKNVDDWFKLYNSYNNFRNHNFLTRRKFVLELFDKSEGKFLDVGCGTGEYIFGLLEKGGEIFAVDQSQGMLAKAKERVEGTGLEPRVHFMNHNIENLNFPDSFFDAVICVGVLEYLTEDKIALQEINRVMKENGTLVITVPNRASPFILLEIFYFELKNMIIKLLPPAARKKINLYFRHKCYAPWELDNKLINSCFKKKDYRFCTFGSYIFSNYIPFSAYLSKKMEKFCKSWFGFLGANYIVKAVKYADDERVL